MPLMSHTLQTFKQQHDQHHNNTRHMAIFNVLGPNSELQKAYGSVSELGELIEKSARTMSHRMGSVEDATAEWSTCTCIRRSVVDRISRGRVTQPVQATRILKARRARQEDSARPTAHALNPHQSGCRTALTPPIHPQRPRGHPNTLITCTHTSPALGPFPRKSFTHPRRKNGVVA